MLYVAGSEERTAAWAWAHLKTKLEKKSRCFEADGYRVVAENLQPTTYNL
jgi:hypothetical protein